MPDRNLTQSDSHPSFDLRTSPITRRNFLALAVGSGVVLLTGCGGGGGGSQSPANAGNRGSGGVAGRLWKDGAGNTLFLREGAAQPGGATAVKGATVRIAGLGTGIQTDANGAFLLPNIPAGLRSLQIEGAGLAPTTLPLTVVGDATVDIGVWPVTRSVASDKAKTALTAAGVPQVNDVRIFGPQHPLPTGMLVVPRLDAVSVSASTPNARTLATPTWFFYCDLSPGDPFSHPVLYVYVDAVTGAVTTEKRMSWPTLNKQHFYAPTPLDPAMPDLIQPGRAAQTRFPQATNRIATPAQSTLRSRAHGAGQLYSTEIYAFPEAPSAVATLSMFGHAGLPGDIQEAIHLTRWDHQNEWLKDRVIAHVKDVLTRADSHDYVLLDFNGHGTLIDGEYYMVMPVSTDASYWEGLVGSDKEYLRPQELGLDKAHVCSIVVVAGTCYAGNWATYAQNNLDLEGTEVTVFCAAPISRVSYGLLNAGEGVRNCTIFREEVAKETPESGQAGLLAAAARAVTRSQDFFDNVIKLDDKYKDAEASYATFWSRSRKPGEECDLTLSPVTGQTSINNPITFHVKLNNRVSGGPSARIKITTTLGELAGPNGSGTSITLDREGDFTLQSPTAGSASVKATVFNVSGGGERELGDVTAVVTITDQATQVIPGTPGIGFFPYYVEQYGFWGYAIEEYVVIKKVNGAKFYTLTLNGAPEQTLQDTLFAQSEKASQSVLFLEELVAKIGQDEYWHHVHRRSGGQYASREKAVEDYNKHPIDPNDPFFKTKWTWTAHF